MGFTGSAFATAVSRWLQFGVMLAITLIKNRRDSRARRARRRDRSRERSDNSETTPLLDGGDGVGIEEGGTDMFVWSLWEAHAGSRGTTFFSQFAGMALTGLLEDGQLQLIAVLAGRLGSVAAAAHNGIFQVIWVLSSFCWAVSDVTRIRLASCKDCRSRHRFASRSPNNRNRPPLACDQVRYGCCFLLCLGGT